MKNKTKIYFIGRKQGVGLRKYRLSHLENRRKFEAEGFKDANKKIKQVRLIQNADVVWVRVRPEITKDNERDIIQNRLKKIRKAIPIINDISVFDNYDCKDNTFDLWIKHNVNCPSFLVLEPAEVEQNLNKNFDKLLKFIKRYNKIFLRTNNETASKGIYVLTPQSSKNQIKTALFSLLKRCKVHQLKRKSTRIIGVEFLKSDCSSGFQDLYRAHVLFGRIISFYAVTSKKDVFHNIDMTIKDLDRFITLNQKFQKKLETLKSEIIKAVESLDCNLGAIEFFLINNKPIFIELNPMWGGHASNHGFGNESVQSYLINNRTTLENSIPNIYNFMDRKSYYKNLFEYIHEYISKTTML